ncbi:MAG: hypothetical protein Q7S22_00955 [Candidatus Micrarchaeota archaeon]|nr:hypothetical protein [Candidatus Micrarchaeota archaeon]
MDSMNIFASVKMLLKRERVVPPKPEKIVAPMPEKGLLEGPKTGIATENIVRVTSDPKQLRLFALLNSSSLSDRVTAATEILSSTLARQSIRWTRTWQYAYQLNPGEAPKRIDVYIARRRFDHDILVKVAVPSEGEPVVIFVEEENRSLATAVAQAITEARGGIPITVRQGIYVF